MTSQAMGAAPPPHSEDLELARQLISRISVTPADSGCQDIVQARLQALGCSVHRLPQGEVQNIWLGHGSGKPSLLLLGHTDVVPPGSGWQSDPFVPQVRDGCLYGRGAADMKGAVAAMVVAMERFIKARPHHQGQIALALTSDEEGPAEYGSKCIARWLREQEAVPDYCLVGEPTASVQPGDFARCGRRGSLSASVVVSGEQGHVAYPEKCSNPIHQILPALSELAVAKFDNGNAHFPGTSLQIVQLASGIPGVLNLVPGQCEFALNLRYSPETDAASIKQRVTEIINKYAPHNEIRWQHSAEPFYSESGRLHQAVQQAVRVVTGQDCIFNACGGTSDGRFIAPLGVPVIELGLCNATIHQVDEHVQVTHLQQLVEIYLQVMFELLP